MSKKTAKRIDTILTYGLPIVAAVFWPYILGILLGLFAFLVVIGIVIKGVQIGCIPTPHGSTREHPYNIIHNFQPYRSTVKRQLIMTKTKRKLIIRRTSMKLIMKRKKNMNKEYWTISGFTGYVDDPIDNDMGEFCGYSDSGEPLFVCDGEKTKKRYSSLTAAESECKKIASALQPNLEFNVGVSIVPVHHYHEDGDWEKEVEGDDFYIQYKYKDLTGCIVVFWRWLTHIGYCRSFVDVKEVCKYDECHDDSLLIEVDHVGSLQCSLLFTAEEVERMEKDGVLWQKVREELHSKHWKWNNPGLIELFV